MKNQSEKIIEKIKKDHIVMESYFRLNWKNYLFWIVLLGTLSIGALFFSFIIINLLDIRLEIFRYLGVGRIFRSLISTAPYLWLGLFVLALISGYLAFRKTRRGYRYSILAITSIGVIVVSMAGVIFHLTGISATLGRGMPDQGRMTFPIQERWSHPKDKLLGGEIIELHPNDFMLVNFRDEIWEVKYSKETELVKLRQLEVGMQVGIIGEIIGENKFNSELIQALPCKIFPNKKKMPKNKMDRPLDLLQENRQ
jgi:hypothetical protein